MCGQREQGAQGRSPCYIPSFGYSPVTPPSSYRGCIVNNRYNKTKDAKDAKDEIMDEAIKLAMKTDPKMAQELKQKWLFEQALELANKTDPKKAKKLKEEWEEAGKMNDNYYRYGRRICCWVSGAREQILGLRWWYSAAMMAFSRYEESGHDTQLSAKEVRSYGEDTMCLFSY